MSSGPNRHTEAYKARKRIRDARYRRNHYTDITQKRRERILNRGSV